MALHLSLNVAIQRAIQFFVTAKPLANRATSWLHYVLFSRWSLGIPVKLWKQKHTHGRTELGGITDKYIQRAKNNTGRVRIIFSFLIHKRCWVPREFELFIIKEVLRTVIFYKIKIKIKQLRSKTIKSTSLHCKFKQSKLFQVFPNISCFSWLPKQIS